MITDTSCMLFMFLGGKLILSSNNYSSPFIALLSCWQQPAWLANVWTKNGQGWSDGLHCFVSSSGLTSPWFHPSSLGHDYCWHFLIMVSPFFGLQHQGLNVKHYGLIFHQEGNNYRVSHCVCTAQTNDRDSSRMCVCFLSNRQLISDRIPKTKQVTKQHIFWKVPISSYSWAFQKTNKPHHQSKTF